MRPPLFLTARSYGLRNAACRYPHRRTPSISLFPGVAQRQPVIDGGIANCVQQSRKKSLPSNSRAFRRTAPPPPNGSHGLAQALRLLRSAGFRGLGSSLRQDPVTAVAAIAILIVLLGLTAKVAADFWIYFTQFSRYPPEISKPLRRALYYTNYNPQPHLALKYYKKTLQQCDEMGLDPFLDEVMGIRIQVAAWFEKIENYDNAIKTLEALLDDCKKWIEWMEAGIANGSLDKSGKPPLLPPDTVDPNALMPRKEGEEYIPENLWHKRTRVLAKSVAISVKLGELYSDEHILDHESALSRLSWAVEMALGEGRRRLAEGVKEGEGDWLRPQEIGGALEALGHQYESRSEFHLSLPLFLQALRLCQDPCHVSTIMNNLSISFAQHPMGIPVQVIPLSASTTTSDPSIPTTRAQFLGAAQNWARNAYVHSKDVKEADRSPECDEACAVALCNLGDISAMMGNHKEARRRFGEAITMSERIGFSQGINHAQIGIQRLADTSAEQT